LKFDPTSRLSAAAFGRLIRKPDGDSGCASDQPPSDAVVRAHRSGHEQENLEKSRPWVSTFLAEMQLIM
jgi:hypothetical protein